jgi:hypothetical protein
MIQVNKVAVFTLLLSGIVARLAATQELPLTQAVMNEATAPSNDDFDEAIVVASLPFDDTIDTRAATGAADDPVCDGQCGTVWYRYTPEVNNSISVSTWGSDYDTRVFVFTGTRDALEWVSELWSASYRLPVSAGTTYHFMIMSSLYDLVGGRLRLSITDGPPLVLSLIVEPVALMDKQAGVIALRGEMTCSMPAQIYVGILLERFLAQRGLRAFGLIVLDCTAHSPFEIDIQTYSASRFGDYYPPGQYVASATANGFDTFRGEAADVSLGYFPLLVRGAP